MSDKPRLAYFEKRAAISAEHLRVYREFFSECDPRVSAEKERLTYYEQVVAEIRQGCSAAQRRSDKILLTYVWGLITSRLSQQQMAEIVKIALSPPPPLAQPDADTPPAQAVLPPPDTPPASPRL